MEKYVTIGLCVKNAEKVVNTALKSIAIQDYPHNRMKLVIVEDGSTDKTLVVLQKFVSEINTVKSEIFVTGGKGLGVARQIVVDNSEGDYIVWVDDDFKLQSDFVRKHVEFMEKNPAVGAACPLLLVNYSNMVSELESLPFLQNISNMNTIGTGGAIFRLEAILQVKGFDDRIRGAGEDLDLSYRLRVAGWLLMRNSSSTLIQKKEPLTWIQLWRKNIWYGYGGHFLYHKYGSVFKTFPLSIFLFYYGLKLSRDLYPVSHKKKVFLICPFYLYQGVARFIGFIRANCDGYGHL